MSLTICTGAWGPHREAYARPFLASFARYWPADVRLVIYTDGPIADAGRAEVRSLADCDGYSAFMTRHANDPVKCGRKPAEGARWKSSCLAGGYNFRFDAVRFAGQGFIPDDAAGRMLDGDALCWLDADVVTTGPVAEDFIEGLIGDADGAYLGRQPKHSEIGFWAVRLSEHSRAMVMAFADAYRTDHAFKLAEWHSAFVWDDARVWAESHGLVTFRNLTPGGSGHVFDAALAPHLIHRKGARKGFR